MSNSAVIALPQTHLVALRAATLASTEEVEILTPTDLLVSTTAVPSGDNTVPTAGTSDTIAAVVGRIALTAVGIVSAPFWYIAFPITLPVTIALTLSSLGTGFGPAPVPDYGISAFFQSFGIAIGVVAWLGLPLMLGSLVFPPPSDSTAPAAAGVRRRV